MSNLNPERDSHLHPRADHALAGVIGLSASYVTVQLFALAIQATEQEGTARELLTLAAGAAPGRASEHHYVRVGSAESH